MNDAPTVKTGPATLTCLLTDYYLERARKTPSAAAFYSRAGQDWLPITWGTFVAEATELAGALARLGLVSGQRLGIMAPTGLAWERFQLAALLNGVAVVGLDAHDQPERLLAIVKTSALKAIVVSGPDALVRLGCARIPTLQHVISIEDAPAPDGLPYVWSTQRGLQDAVKGSPAPAPGPTPDTLATIVFTSGSTGAPKGIGYSHAQVCLAVDSILEAFPGISAHDRLVCWLPLSNLFQRMLNFCAAGRGAQSYFVSDPRTIVTQLPDIRPHVFVAVPRFFEKLDEGIEQRLAERSLPARALVRWAMAIGHRSASLAREGSRPGRLLGWQAALAERLVLRRLRELLGGEIRFMVSGSAPFPRWLLEKFHAMGLLILEAYGLSENVVPVAINRPDAYRFGTVGRVLRANEVEIAADGEVLVRGAGVFSAYIQQTEAPAIDARGFLATGDLGHFDDDGFLVLSGRKSEIFKTSTGRKIAPLAVETDLKRIEGVDQAVLVGAQRKMTIALLTLTPAVNGIPPTMPALEDVAERIRKAIGPTLAAHPAYARPAGLIVSCRPFTIESGELTSNLKLRRKVIESNYEAAFAALFRRLEDQRGVFCERYAEDLVIMSCEDNP